MPLFVVRFSVDRQNEPGKATIGDSRTNALTTTVQANSMDQARALIQVQYGANCTVHGIKQI